jgi:hypothetical protein
MRYWIDDRVNSLRRFYRHHDRDEMFLQAAADIFYVKIHLHTNTTSPIPFTTIHPRQTSNLHLNSCSRTIRIFIASHHNYGSLPNTTDTIPMICPYPEKDH